MSESEFSRLRQSNRRWIIEVIAGPNMKHLGRRGRRLFGDIASFAALQARIEFFAAVLDVEARVFVSDYEGEILKRVHRSAATADAYIGSYYSYMGALFGSASAPDRGIPQASPAQASPS